MRTIPKARMQTTRPPRLQSHTRDFTSQEVAWVAGHFTQVHTVEPFQAKGNINLDTYEVKDLQGNLYILQRINTDVFTQPLRVMEAMSAWAQAQAEALEKQPHSTWQPITLARTAHGHTYLDIDGDARSVWRMMHKIPGIRCYKSLNDIPSRERQLKITKATGEGLATSANLTRSIPVANLQTSLPGYRDTHGYLQQFHSVINQSFTAEDAEPLLPTNQELAKATGSLYVIKLDAQEHDGRKQKAQDLIELIQEKAHWAKGLQRAVDLNLANKVAIHGDTKIENFLYNDQDQVVSLIDLDTIMPYTWLADWGDLARSLVNVAGEKEPNINKVQVDQEVYDALRAGFLNTTQATETEIKLMPRAVETIAFELGTRFLTDYLRGDDYFALTPTDPPDLNLIRARVQLTLYHRLTQSHGSIAELVELA